jgi:hypothetical protein
VADCCKYYRHEAKLLQFTISFNFSPFPSCSINKKISAGQINPDSNRVKTFLLLNSEWCTQAVVEANMVNSSIVELG